MFQIVKKYSIVIIGGFVIGLIICAWLQYPTWIESKDKSLPVKEETQSKQTPTLTFDALFQQEPTFIPYKLSSAPELSTAKEPSPTRFQALGEKYGTFGDTYGALNTLFSGLAFAFLIITMLIQRQDLKEQRKEIKKSNKIAKKQRKITEQQATLIKQQIDEAKVQNFYLIFLQYLSSLDTQLNKLKITKDTVSIQHDRIFEIFSKDFIESLENDFNYYETQDQKGEVVSPILLTIQYGKTVNKNNIDLNNTQYLKHILMILNFINENKEHINTLPPINTLLAHISNEAILCFAWIAITRNPNLKFMIEEYGLLRELNHQLKPELIKSIKIFFHEKAFREI